MKICTCIRSDLLALLLINQIVCRYIFVTFVTFVKFKHAKRIRTVCISAMFVHDLNKYKAVYGYVNLVKQHCK